MRDNFSPDAPWEDDDGAGLDEESVLDAFDEYAPAREPVDVEDAWTAPELPEDNAATTTVLFTATNPAGTVSVTVLMGGQVLRVNLSPQVTKMTEPELAEEITTIAALARQQAHAGQHAIIARLMHQLGRDPASTRSFLERDIGLPSPESVRAGRATLFAARYAQDQD